MRMRITQTIFVAIRSRWAITPSNKIIHIAIISHFQINTYSTIEGIAREMDIQISDSGFDDLGEDLISLLIMCNTNFDGMARV
jgi:hypothetical protein